MLRQSSPKWQTKRGHGRLWPPNVVTEQPKVADKAGSWKALATKCCHRAARSGRQSGVMEGFGHQMLSQNSPKWQTKRGHGRLWPPNVVTEQPKVADKAGSWKALATTCCHR